MIPRSTPGVRIEPIVSLSHEAKRDRQVLAGVRRIPRGRVTGENALGSSRSETRSQDGAPSLFSRQRDERFDIGKAVASWIGFGRVNSREQRAWFLLVAEDLRKR